MNLTYFSLLCFYTVIHTSNLFFAAIFLHSDPDRGDPDDVLQDAASERQLGLAAHQRKSGFQKLQEIFHRLHSLPCQVIYKLTISQAPFTSATHSPYVTLRIY